MYTLQAQCAWHTKLQVIHQFCAIVWPCKLLSIQKSDSKKDLLHYRQYSMYEPMSYLLLRVAAPGCAAHRVH